MQEVSANAGVSKTVLRDVSLCDLDLELASGFVSHSCTLRTIVLFDATIRRRSQSRLCVVFTDCE